MSSSRAAAPTSIDVHLPVYGDMSRLEDLLRTLSRGDGAPEGGIELHMGLVRFYEPCAIVALLAKILFWRDQGIPVRAHFDTDNGVIKYLQRIDFFNTLGVQVPESFRRHPAGTGFVTIKRITGVDCSSVCRELATCVAGRAEAGDEIRGLLEYALGEVIKNCQQHSRAQGFVMAQYYAQSGLIHVAVGDCGIGILESYRSSFSPYYDRTGGTHAGALLEAIRVESSSKTHLVSNTTGEGPVNRGVGLSICRQLTKQTLGDFLLVSGDAMLRHDARGHDAAAPVRCSHFQGTIASVSFLRSALKMDQCSYLEALTEAKNQIGLGETSNPSPLDLFS